MTTQEVAAEVIIRDMMAKAFTSLNEAAKAIGKSIEGFAESINTTPMDGMKVLGKKKAEKALEQQDAKAFTLGSNGLIQYDTFAGAPGAESIHERATRERYWSSMGKKIRKGSSVR